jgi:hypothetical protein
MRELTAFRKAFRRSVARAEVGNASVRFKNGRLWIWAFIKGIIPMVLLRLVASRPKKTGQVLPCPGNQFFGSREIKTHIIPDLLCLPFSGRIRFAENYPS